MCAYYFYLSIHPISFFFRMSLPFWSFLIFTSPPFRLPSPRPRPSAPVSVPITWDELDDPDLRPDRWTIWTVMDRLAETGDPLAPLIGRHQRIPKL